MAQVMWSLITIISIAVVVSGSPPKYQLLEEWNLWKNQHGKSYESERVELERHLVWLSNKQYIDQHNANSDIFGFTLAMNHYGDLVSIICMLIHYVILYRVIWLSLLVGYKSEPLPSKQRGWKGEKK